MKSLFKNYRNFVYIVVVAILVCSAYFSIRYIKNDDRLSKAEILSLRENYPICGVDVPPLMSMVPDSPQQFDYHLSKCESIIYGEIVGDCTFYTKNISTGYEELDEKFMATGIGTSYKFYEYKLSVIEDISGVYHKGDIITITDNTAYINYNPTFSDGMEIIIPVYKSNDKRHPDRKPFGAVGIYYVTEDGYAISAFNEETRSNYKLSGLKVEKAMEKLTKLKAKKK